MRQRFARLYRFMSFAAIGGGVFAVGLSLQWQLVRIGVSVTVAYTIQLLLTIWLNFELNRRITWRDRGHDKMAPMQFLVGRLMTAAAAFVIFVSLMQLPYMHHLIANGVSVALAMGANYVIGDRYIFRVPSDQNDLTYKETFLNPTVFRWIVIGLIMGGLAVVLVALPQMATMFILTLASLYATLAFVLGTIAFLLFDYSNRTPEARAATRFPEPRDVPDSELVFISFILPAKDEEAVIGATLKRLAQLDYPRDRYEVLVTLRDDDPRTVATASAVAASYPDLIRIITRDYRGMKITNKSTQMNVALDLAHGNFVCPVDAESLLAPGIARRIDAIAADPEITAIQGPVQLVNLENRSEGTYWQQLGHFIRSGWFVPHNVMEYRSWFSSRMFFQLQTGYLPLGGNTVFVRTAFMRSIGGWNERMLTEDAYLGTQLSVKGAKMAIAYDPEFATTEHTPPSIFGSGSMTLQRIRWSQGFWQVLRHGLWRELPTFRQRLVALYSLGTPLIQAFTGILLPFAVLAAFFLKAPLPVTMALFLPFGPLLLTMVVQLIEFNRFCRDFSLQPKLRHYLALVLGYFPYQFLLGLAAVAAVIREARGINSWSKTARNPTLHTRVASPSTTTPEGVIA